MPGAVPGGPEPHVPGGPDDSGLHGAIRSSSLSMRYLLVFSTLPVSIALLLWFKGEPFCTADERG